MPMDTERIIGELKEFKRASIERFDDLDDEISGLKKEVRSLTRFRWKVAGGFSVLFVLFELLKTKLGG